MLNTNNSGDYNSGNRNSGNYNSGDYNSGNWNSGNWNSGDWNFGAFNTSEPKMRLFNRELNMTVSEFWSEYDLNMNVPLNRWVDKSEMTDKEKESVSGWESMGGYLKTLNFKEACRIWWKENPEEHERFLTLPGFDAKIFEEITGIDVDKQDAATEEAITLLKSKGYRIVKE